MAGGRPEVDGPARTAPSSPSAAGHATAGRHAAAHPRGHAGRAAVVVRRLQDVCARRGTAHALRRHTGSAARRRHAAPCGHAGSVAARGRPTAQRRPAAADGHAGSVAPRRHDAATGGRSASGGGDHAPARR